MLNSYHRLSIFDGEVARIPFSTVPSERDSSKKIFNFSSS
jgi:hypothetical protein